MAQKNTTLIYIDEKNLRKYERLNPEQFKTFFMTLFKYRTGDNWDETISVFDGNAGLQNMLEEYLGKVDANNEKWEKRAKASAENGPKGGRPRKGETKEEYQERKAKENTPSTYDIEPNEGFKKEKPVDVPQEPSTFDTEPKNNQEKTTELKKQIISKYQTELNKLVQKKYSGSDIMDNIKELCYKVTDDDFIVLDVSNRIHNDITESINNYKKKKTA